MCVGFLKPHDGTASYQLAKLASCIHRYQLFNSKCQTKYSSMSWSADFFDSLFAQLTAHIQAPFLSVLSAEHPAVTPSGTSCAMTHT